MASGVDSIVSRLADGAREEFAWSILSALERCVAAVLLIALSPALLLVGLAIFALSGKSPLVAHRRIGQYGVPFWILKFRTMWPNSRARWAGPALMERIVDESGPRFKAADDPRVTSRLAKLCRRFSVDELPQLVHVLRGELSLVGPRPLTESELASHYGVDAALVLQMKPGLTGLWQVSGRNRLTYEERRNLDIQLVREKSIPLYFSLLLRTVPQVLLGRHSF